MVEVCLSTEPCGDNHTGAVCEELYPVGQTAGQEKGVKREEWLKYSELMTGPTPLCCSGWGEEVEEWEMKQ